jgi:hypothetical protein
MSAWINATFGLTGSAVGALLSDVWKLVAIAVALAIIAAYAWPRVRGVRRGDVLIAFVRRQQQTPFGIASLTEPVFVTALQNGRIKEKIRVQLQNGSLAEGVIEEYAGTISPPAIRLTETETVEVRFEGGGGSGGAGGARGRRGGNQNNYGEYKRE